jgi:hypothetical protein
MNSISLSLRRTTADDHHFGDVNEMVLDPMATVETRQTSLAVLYRLLPQLPEQSQSVWGSRYP